METLTKKTILSKGQKIERARRVIGITQGELALRIGGISKQALSKWEQSEEINEAKLEQVAVALGVTKNFIDKCSDDALLFHIEHLRENSFTYAFYFNCTFNPLDKVVELYERLLQVEKEKNEYLMSKLQDLHQ